MLLSKFYEKVIVIYFGCFSIPFEKITFYTKNLTQKVEFWIFFSLVSLMNKDQKSTFLLKISV